ncbi:hypothetical protein PVAP13_5NG255400 [Panicum virgatum]|uniref:Uncharacterized protein n=1 Tax=Panicum virgatum TaxID=38727 RepID=A0A8T0RWY6_PANVG|nr:hypothetical protein PVAP13_5NG226129 [Panicum virgatum]KAG2589136.1 hypothetical protein PVAP13_5NG255400 [Panicum virgatum]
MEALKAMPPAEGNAVVSSAEVVSKVLPKNSSNIFLKNIAKERALEAQLSAERQGSALLQEEMIVLKQKSHSTEQALEKTRRELEEYKRQVEENKKATEETNALMRRFFMINSGANSGPSV